MQELENLVEDLEEDWHKDKDDTLESIDGGCEARIGLFRYSVDAIRHKGGLITMSLRPMGGRV